MPMQRRIYIIPTASATSGKSSVQARYTEYSPINCWGSISGQFLVDFNKGVSKGSIGQIRLTHTESSYHLNCIVRKLLCFIFPCSTTTTTLQ